ncbi:MAG TPA: class I SAM-dependent rRNA methyltransferase [Blastocatellia bacterium]|nr:class I SAM-dependent rRNA methyltransferase [Blastocatellia bacterium]
MGAIVKVNERGAVRVRGRHCWVYRSDLLDATDAGAGEIVLVTDNRNRVLGRAFYSSRSQIALRFFAFDDGETGPDFWNSRLEDAERLRRLVVNNATAYRLVYGESDMVPSLIIDRYADCFVIQTLSQGADALKQLWVDLLVDRYRPRAIIERNEARVRDLEGLSRVNGVLYGSDPGEVVIDEAGVRFAVDLSGGQKTGAFLDQRENRIAAEQYAGARVLDCFTYEGGFALHLARRAGHVVAADVSVAALEKAKRNAELNSVSSVDFVEGNVFDLLREFEIAGDRFDAIILDPPAFAKNRAAVESAIRGYKEINLRAMKLLNPGGFLITSSCSYNLSETDFLNLIAAAAADSGRPARIIEKRGQSRDHPVLVAMPETHYLKCVVLQVR